MPLAPTIGAGAGALAGEIVDQVFFAKKPTSAGRMQREVERGRAPRDVDRVDKGNPSDPGDAHPHVELKDGRALRRDGTWKHAEGEVSRAIGDWLKMHGWEVPK